jgi:hypothetical protein
MKTIRDILIGSIITDVGLTVDVEGGLTFKFITKENKQGKIVFGYTELGEWCDNLTVENTNCTNLPDGWDKTIFNKDYDNA